MSIHGLIFPPCQSLFYRYATFFFIYSRLFCFFVFFFLTPILIFSPRLISFFGHVSSRFFSTSILVFFFYVFNSIFISVFYFMSIFVFSSTYILDFYLHNCSCFSRYYPRFLFPKFSFFLNMFSLSLNQFFCLLFVYFPSIFVSLFVFFTSAVYIFFNLSWIHPHLFSSFSKSLPFILFVYSSFFPQKNLILPQILFSFYLHF